MYPLKEENNLSTEPKQALIYTYPGVYIDLLDPDPAQIRVDAIARVLSRTPRWGGHLDVGYSVADHALLCREIVRLNGYPEYGFAALHHDDSEWLLGDIPTPLRRELGAAYTRVEATVDHAILRALAMSAGEFASDIVLQVDRLAYRLEREVFIYGNAHVESATMLDVAPDLPEYVMPTERRDEESSYRAFLDAHLEDGGVLSSEQLPTGDHRTKEMIRSLAMSNPELFAQVAAEANLHMEVPA
jgi:hypothetical protein